MAESSKQQVKLAVVVDGFEMMSRVSKDKEVVAVQAVVPGNARSGSEEVAFTLRPCPPRRPFGTDGLQSAVIVVVIGGAADQQVVAPRPKSVSRPRPPIRMSRCHPPKIRSLPSSPSAMSLP